MTTGDCDTVDRLDAVLIELLTAEPQGGRARGVPAARRGPRHRAGAPEPMQQRGVITGYGPEVDPATRG